MSKDDDQVPAWGPADASLKPPGQAAAIQARERGGVRGAMAVTIRLAVQADIDALLALDAVGGVEERRHAKIERWVAAGEAVAADDGSCLVGYAALEYTFFDQGFIAMLQVAPSYRRNGVATSLLRYLERTCRTPKLFTSTNESNAPMRALMETLGYEPSGVVHNLDEGDPELFFYKAL
ncbi:MAG: GNAT family N-acetyltransferase [Myxococcota bacterium]